MRYYSLILSNPTTNAVIRKWTSHPNGVQQPPDPGALNLEFDIFVSSFGTPKNPGGSVITIEGIQQTDLFQAQQFVGLNFTLYGGMGKGLPLADAAQSGLLLSGTVFQSFGNWIGEEMTLDLVVTGINGYTLDAPGNFTVNWPAKQPLNVGIANVLSQAYPGVKQNIQIASGISFPNAEWHICSTLRQFANYVQNLTSGFGNSSYPGISIAIYGGQFFVYDGTDIKKTVPIKATDFVGQPTWIQSGTIQVKTVMRGDIQLNNIVTMPSGLQGSPGVTTTPSSFVAPSSRYQTAFQGQFIVSDIRHVGNFRSQDGAQWSSIFNCVTPNANAS